ncbi:MAG: HipA N-terminal domain-containing protein [Gammaproteobacteria bacterium]|nr:HipA N-terminal domain-containing protein [Gammaproteobacteria bacterium]
MRKAQVYNHGVYAGQLIEVGDGTYEFIYDEQYKGPAISLTMPVSKQRFTYKQFPSFFDGLLPEGMLLEALLKNAKIDRKDLFSQIVTVGKDLVGSVTVEGEA